MRNTLQDLKYGENSDKRGKCETHMVRYEISRKTLKNVKNEKQTLQDMEFVNKTHQKGE